MSVNKHQALIADYPKFKYEMYTIEAIDDQLMLSFNYRLVGQSGQDVLFTHRVSYELFGMDKALINLHRVKDLDALIFSIGMVEAISYYKTTCAPFFEISCGRLTPEQKTWWQKLYYHGLGELLYLNGLSNSLTLDNLIHFVDDERLPNPFEEVELSLSGNLIPVGGGKDSVVTLDMLKDQKEDNLCFVMAPPKAAYDCIEVAGYTNYLLANRYFDKQLFGLNDAGFLNGHVPFSAILGFIAVFGAALTGKRYIPLSNERSANEATVLGESFNHQYSKSYEFEEDFNHYLERYLLKDVKYFSLLRPLYEIGIAERFAPLTQYHSVFRSCNRGKKNNTWCGICSKCLFVYIILRPYLSLEAMKAIFGYDLLDNQALEPIFLELLGIEGVKPFECVGTVDEVKLSMKALVSQSKPDQLPYLAKRFVEIIDLDQISSLDISPAKDLIPDAYRKYYEV